MLNIWPNIPWLRWRPELPEEGPPSLRIAPESKLGAWPGALGLAVPDHPPDAGTDAVLDGTVRPADGGGNPFGFGNGQRMPVDPFVRDRGLLLPRSTPLLFPNMAESGLLGLGLRSLGGEPQPNTYAPGFRTDVNGSGTDSIDATSPVGNPSIDPTLPADVVHSETPPVYDTTYFPQRPQDQAHEAPDQIVQSYADAGSRPITAFDGPNFSPMLAPTNARVARDSHSGTSGTFDPRFIVPVQTPPPIRTPPPVARPSPAPQPQPQPPQPGIRHNQGPALETTPLPRSTIPQQPAPAGSLPRPPSATEPPPNAAGPAAAAAKQRLDAPRPVHPLPRTAEAWDKIVKERAQDAPGGQYEGSDGLETSIGVRINPLLPEPAAGRDYLPTQEHLRNAYKGELELANRITRALKDEIIVHYGMRAGLRGPDVVSVSPDGDVTVWDSKWRGSPRSIGDSAAAHQARGSLNIALSRVRDEIDRAVKSGRLPPEVAKKAVENAKKGNLFINTIGTGNAHGSVVRCVRNEEIADCWSN
jgi:hypothetical protein